MKKKYLAYKLFIAAITALGFGFRPKVIYAVDRLPESSYKSINDISKILSSITNFLLLLVGAAATLFLVIGGLQYITSSGDPQKAATAKKTILYAIVGIIVVLLAKVVLNIILSLFK